MWAYAKRIINHFVDEFTMLRTSVRALVYLRWIYEFAGGMLGIFLQVFLYQKFTSITLNMLGVIAACTGVMFGLCVAGYFAARYRMNIKYAFAVSFVVTAASIVFVMYIATIYDAFLALLCFGFGQGFFYLTTNSLELYETKDSKHQRDLYASMLSAGHICLYPTSIALGALLIWISRDMLGWGAYSLLFASSAGVYLLGFSCLYHISDYRPKPITREDVKHFFTDRVNQAAQLYIIGSSIQDALSLVIPLSILAILGGPLWVGWYSAAFALVSAFCVLGASLLRRPDNRLLFFGITSVGMAVVYALFAYTFSLWSLVVYSVASGVLGAVLGVTQHVMDMDVMDTGRKETDFFPTLILRDFFLWVGRFLTAIAFIVALTFVQSDLGALSLGLYMIAGALVVSFLGAVIFVRLMRKGALASS
jgi:hypothetical protein